MLVDCVWDKWQVGECSKRCGGGTRTNIRKLKVNSAHGGEACYGMPNITESCNVQECPGTKFSRCNTPLLLNS